MQVGVEQTVELLEGGQGAEVSTVFDTSNVAGRVVITVVADPLDLIPESDETNNRGERPVEVKLPSSYLPSDLTVDVDLTTAFLNWLSSPFAGVEHYVVRGGRIVNEGLMDVGKDAVVTGSDVKEAHMAALAADGNYQTWWRRNVTTEGWLEMDLGRDYHLHALVINWLDAGIGRDFKVLAWDGEKFVEKLTVVGNEDRNSVHYFEPEVRTRRVRLQGLTPKSAGGPPVGICEINVLALEPVK